MKKEIEITFEITFEKRESESKKGILAILVHLDSHAGGYLYIGNDERVEFAGNDFVEKLLGTLDFVELMKIPEIKEMYEEYFKKEVDLFGFLENEVYAMHFIERDGTTGFFDYTDVVEKRKEIERLKANYNLFPSKVTCANAIPMSLDERKQYLFALAKGYEVLTREEVHVDGKYYCLFIGNPSKRWRVTLNSYDSTSNIYFGKEKHVEECANFMNESEGKR